MAKKFYKDMPNSCQRKIINNEFIREEFPASREFIYFNAGRMGLLPVSSHRVLSKYYEQKQLLSRQNLEIKPKTIFFNREQIRRKIASFIGAKKNEIVLTQNTCQGIDIVLNGLQLRKGDEIITTDHEYIGTYPIIYNLARRIGLKLNIVKLSNYNSGNLLSGIDRAINKKAKLLLISHVTYNTGLRLPVANICELAHKKNIPVLIDGAQALGWMKVNVKELNCDFYACCGHKWMLGPSGTGLLFIQKGWVDKIAPMFIGWASIRELKSFSDLSFQDGANRFENGTISIGLFSALCRSLDLLEDIGLEMIEKRLSHLSVLMRNELTDIKSTRLLSPLSWEISSPLVSFSLDKYSLDELHTYLRRRHNIITNIIHESGCMRVSIGLWNTKKDIEKFIEVLKQYLNRH